MGRGYTFHSALRGSERFTLLFGITSRSTSRTRTRDTDVTNRRFFSITEHPPARVIAARLPLREAGLGRFVSEIEGSTLARIVRLIGLAILLDLLILG